MHSYWNVEISQVWWPESEMPFFRLNNCSSTINWVRLCRSIRNSVIIAATFRGVPGPKQTFQSGSWCGRRCRRRWRVPGRLQGTEGTDVARRLPKLVGHGVLVAKARQGIFIDRSLTSCATCATACETCRAIREGFPSIWKTRQRQFVETRWSTCNKNQRWEPMSQCWMSKRNSICIKTSWFLNLFHLSGDI